MSITAFNQVRPYVNPYNSPSTSPQTKKTTLKSEPCNDHENISFNNESKHRKVDRVSKKALSQTKNSPDFAKSIQTTVPSTRTKKEMSQFLKQRQADPHLRKEDLGFKSSSTNVDRKKTEYIINKTASVGEVGEEIKSVHKHNGASILEGDAAALIHQRVLDHAYLRMQIMYFQLVLYYNENCSVQWGPTEHQHGISHCEQCAASHSALLPHVKDNYGDVLKESLLSGKVSDKVMKRLAALMIKGTDLEKQCRIEKMLSMFINDQNQEGFLRGLDLDIKDGLLSENCHFQHACNATNMLPKIVNDYDLLIEHAYRILAVDLINECSKGKIKPYDALEVFAQRMQGFFDTSEKATLQAIELLKKRKQVESELIALENGNIPKEKKYLSLINELNAINSKLNLLKESKKMLSIPESKWPEARATIFESMFRKINKDINQLDQIQQIDDIKRFCEKHGLQYILSRYDLKSHPKPERLNSIKAEICQQLQTRDYDPTLIAIVRTYVNEGRLNGNWSPTHCEKDIAKLTCSLKIIEWEKKASSAPSEEWLLGKTRNTYEDVKLDIMTRTPGDVANSLKLFT